eukprot:14885620-Ditylum_brightwellii.AAC.1
MSPQRHNQHDETALNDISNKLGPDVDIFQGNPSRSVSAQLRFAKKERKICHNNSYKLCQEFLERLADDIIDGDTTKDRAKIIQGIKDKESKKRIYAIMHRHLKPQDRSGLTQLNIPEWD